ncbi:MAG: pseudouridine synthase [Cyclobacteriaceae bacterium]
MSRRNKLSYFLIHKPYKVLSQFSDENGNPGLGSLYDLAKDVYPVGRLDLDSEGLLILTNDKALNNKLLNPANNHKRTYWVEVEGTPEKESLARFEAGLEINLKGKKYKTKKSAIRLIKPDVIDRDPPVNIKKHPIRSWVEVVLTEGKNRQVRKMTAAIGHPTLRLIRVSIEGLEVFPLKSGEIRQVSKNVVYQKLDLL